MPMKNPPHPGGFVLRQCIEPLGLTITQAAAALGVTRTTLSELVNGKRGISPEMAVRLSKVFGGSPESWLTHSPYRFASDSCRGIETNRQTFGPSRAPGTIQRTIALLAQAIHFALSEIALLTALRMRLFSVWQCAKG